GGRRAARDRHRLCHDHAHGHRALRGSGGARDRRSRHPAPQGRERHQARVRPSRRTATRNASRHLHHARAEPSAPLPPPRPPSPTWARHAAGRLAFANGAYALAVEATDAADAVARNLDLLDRGGREGLERAHAQREPFAARLPVIVAGTRRILDIFDLTTHSGSAGIGIDATEIETMRAEMARMVEAHRRTLDQLPTAVAIFGANQRLTFYNAAYRALWSFPAEFLDHQPTDSAVLDRLRAARKLPEQADFRSWKAQLHAAYRALESHEHQWHLPDGRTLRVITTPSPEGGVTYLFDDVTERLDLERRFDALIRVQSETLDNLSEGVAVFGSDGRLRLYNPVFACMWQLAPSALAGRPHIEA